MQGLQSKIEPHFLFNSLNSISELVHIDPEKADQAIQSLSVLLRNNLSGDDHMHSLKDELALTQHFVELEKLRLGERVRLNWNDEIPSNEKETILIPKLTLQPLVENALRYGVATNIDGGDINVQLSSIKNRIKITVFNTRNEAEASIPVGGAGIALKNIRERLFLIYDDQCKLVVSDKPTFYNVEILIPKKVVDWRNA